MQLTIATAGGLKRKGGKALTMNDFLPDYAKPKKKKLTEDELTADLKKQFADFIISTPPSK